MKTVLVVLGTRPEVVKLAPVIRLLQKESGVRCDVCVTGQHRGMVDQLLRVFNIRPAHDLDVMEPGQTLASSTARILKELAFLMEAQKPALMIVQGDTTTALAAGLAGFYGQVPVGHVEAGLRTGNFDAPFPEEMNRVLLGRLASLHFCPTEDARNHLLCEGVKSDRIALTGNTGIDALLQVATGLSDGSIHSPEPEWLQPGRKLILVTAHRRENFGAGLHEICEALAALAQRNDVQIAFPVHPNPSVEAVVRQSLGHLPSINLMPPLDYLQFVDLMRRCHFLLTDSGGVQEEAPALGKPVLVLRSVTERAEAVQAGTAVLVGTDRLRIEAYAKRLLDEPAYYGTMSTVHFPFGDGRAAERIVKAIVRFIAEGR